MILPSAPMGPPVGVLGLGAPGGNQLPLEQSYIENILRLNLGKMATIYMTFENNAEWNAKIFRGQLEAAGRDHIIISDPANGMRYLLLMVNLDYVTFEEPLNYFYPYGPPSLEAPPLGGPTASR
ncbi:spore coat protein GerQ [Paenibacillus xerothermodurans]|uniref:Spore coat protein GerQ n=2 Tax=Paenibacillus xerothermodurans TaxID=1977292 RepID=A0A2W1P2Z8_PAEXE|nr:spore coat protein GerQ [Paenibacillus xerothermodurans]